MPIPFPHRWLLAGVSEELPAVPGLAGLQLGEHRRKLPNHRIGRQRVDYPAQSKIDQQRKFVDLIELDRKPVIAV
jgi:hypothetical protein